MILQISTHLSLSNFLDCQLPAGRIPTTVLFFDNDLLKNSSAFFISFSGTLN